MGPSDNRRVYGDLARQLLNGEVLLDEQRLFLANCFRFLSVGADANVVFGLKHGRGQSDADAEGRMMVSVLLHMVAANVEDGMGLEESLSVVSTQVQKFFVNSEPYDATYLKKCWYKYPHMQTSERNKFNTDFPYDE